MNVRLVCGISALMTLFAAPPIVLADDSVAYRAIVAPNGGPIRPLNTACAVGACRYPAGMVDGYLILAVPINNGTNGEANKVHIFLDGIGGNGGATADLGVIPAYKGDRMTALFIANKMYLVNEIYLPGEAHCCGTQVVVTKWGVVDNHLAYFGLHTFPIAQRDSRTALASASYAMYDANWLLHPQGQ